MNELLLNNDLTLLNNSLQHAGVPGMKWYRHQFGDWQSQAVYAHGQSDPNAKERKTPYRDEKKRRNQLEAYSQDAAKVRMRAIKRADKAIAKEEKLKKKIAENPHKYSEEETARKLKAAERNTKRETLNRDNMIRKSNAVDKSLEKYVKDLKTKYGDTKIKDLKFQEKYKNGKSLGKYLKSNALLKRELTMGAKNAFRYELSKTLGLPLGKHETYIPGTNKIKTSYYLNMSNNDFGILDASMLVYAQNKMGRNMTSTRKAF